MGEHERSRWIRRRRQVPGPVLEHTSQIALTQAVVRAVLAEKCRDRQLAAPPEFAAALASPGPGLVPYWLSRSEMVMIAPDPDADPDEVWAAVNAA